MPTLLATLMTATVVGSLTAIVVRQLSRNHARHAQSSAWHPVDWLDEKGSDARRVATDLAAAATRSAIRSPQSPCEPSHVSHSCGEWKAPVTSNKSIAAQ